MVKVISVSDETYAMLVKLKGKKMSFSETIKAAIAKGGKGDLMRSFGVLKDKRRAKEWIAAVYKERERTWRKLG